MLTLNQIESKFLILVSKAVGAPYVWGGKGDKIWTPERLIDHPWLPRDVFDCAGLITTSLYRAGGPDLRASHGARQLHEACPKGLPTDRLRLRFYPGHVALILPINGPGIYVYEAAGGDHTTTAPSAGRVRCGREQRRDFFLADGSLSALISTLTGLRS